MLAEIAPDPVRLLTISRRSESPSKQYVVMIERRLLAKGFGEWTVPTLLRLIRGITKENQKIEQLRDSDAWISRLCSAAGLFQRPMEIPQNVSRPDQEIEQLPRIPRRETPAAPNCQNKRLRQIWTELVNTYFPTQQDLHNYRVVWSGRDHTSTLASCQIEKRIVRVAAIMQKEEASPYLEALIYHELCHAALGPVPRRNGRRVIHGREFKALEKKHPGIPQLNLWISRGGWRHLVMSERRKRTKR